MHRSSFVFYLKYIETKSHCTNVRIIYLENYWAREMTQTRLNQFANDEQEQSRQITLSAICDYLPLQENCFRRKKFLNET